VLYTALGVLDYGFTIAAFVTGAREANPALAWFAEQGLFEFVKLSLTLLVCCVGTHLWSLPIARRAVALGNVLMGGVLTYHLLHLSHYAGQIPH
jgi:uncharacterized membrane protein YidH (DUF202 family)